MSTRPSRVRWLLIFWMFVISAIAFLDRVNIGIAGTSMERAYGFDHVKFGLVASAFNWGYALFQAPGGRLADRFGPRRILALGTLWWAVFTALTAAVPVGLPLAIAAIVAVRFSLGIGEAVVYPAGNRLVASWIPLSERGIANGLIFAGVGAGSFFAPPLITYVLINWGWRWSFWISAVIGLAGGIVWFVIARDKPEDHPSVNDGEAALIREGLPRTEASSKPVAWRAIFTSRDVAAVTASYFCYGYVAYIFFTWFFIYLNAVRGLNLKTSAVYSMLPFAAMAICSSVGGWISDVVTKAAGKRAGRCGVAGAAMVLCTIFLALAMFAADARLASVVLAGGAGALYLSQSSFWSVSSEMAGASSGSVSGVMNMGGQIAGAVTALMTPIIAKYFGWNTPFFVAAGLCCLGGLFWMWVDIDRGAASLSRLDVGQTRPQLQEHEMNKFFKRGWIGRAVVFSVLFVVAIVLADAPRAFSRPAEASTDAGLLDGYRHVEVASVSDALEKITGQRMYLSHRMKPIFTSRFAGFAVTVKLRKEENQDPHALDGMLAAIDQGGPNSVYVMVVEDGADIAGMGGLMGTAMQARGFSGAVIDGGVRDTAYLTKIGFPVYALGNVPSTSVGHYRFAGANVPVECDSVMISAGDVVAADPDGVVVVPRAKAAEVLAMAQDMDFKEHSMYAYIEKLKSIEEAVKKFGRL